MRIYSLKRWGIAASAVLLALAFTACGRAGGSAKPAKMSIRTAELSEDEENILKLMQFGGNVRLYDFSVDDSIRSVAVNCYKLNKELKWEENGGIFSEVTSRTGRIAVTTEGGSMKVSCQDEKGTAAYTFGSPEQKALAEGMSSAISWNDTAEIVPEQEIPLAVQLVTSGDEIRSYGTESYYDTERLSGYDEVNAIVITFSAEGTEEPREEPVGEAEPGEEDPKESRVGAIDSKSPDSESPDPFERSGSYTARFEIFRVDEHGILAGGLDREIGLYHVGHGSYLRDSDGKKLSVSDLRPGMIVELNWNGMVQESYPGQFSYDGLKVTGETGSKSFTFYTQLLKDLAEVDSGLNEGIERCFVDLSKVQSLTDREKEGLTYLCGSYYGVMADQQTEEELVQSGILDPVKGLERGILVTVEETSDKGNTLVCSARKYRSGTGAYYFSDVTASYADGEWSYQIGIEAIS